MACARREQDGSAESYPVGHRRSHRQGDERLGDRPVIVRPGTLAVTCEPVLAGLVFGIEQPFEDPDAVVADSLCGLCGAEDVPGGRDRSAGIGSAATRPVSPTNKTESAS